MAAGDRSQFVPHPEEQPLLARMLALRAAGLGAWRIAANLNAAGEGNPRTGRPWSYGTLAAILWNRDRREAAAVAYPPPPAWGVDLPQHSCHTFGMKTCATCQKQLDSSARTCPNCGRTFATGPWVLLAIFSNVYQGPVS